MANDQYQVYGVSGAYTLAPGLLLQSDLMFVDEDVRTAAAGPTFNNEGYVFVVGTRLDF